MNNEKKITSNQIEENLLNRELKIIDEKLRKIGEQLTAVFEPYYYGKKGFGAENFSADFSALIKSIMFADCSYYYYTKAKLSPSHLPEAIKKAILQKVTTDFINRVRDIEEIATECAAEAY